MAGDPAFEAFLLGMVQRGHTRDWIRRNLPAVKAIYRRDNQAVIPCPPEPQRQARDRYEEL